MPAYIAKKGFLYYLRHKKWKIRDFLDPILFVPLAYVVLKIIAEGITPLNVIIILAGLAYLTVIFRLLREKK